MIIDGVSIQCPKCGWEPDGNDLWICDVCKTRWNTFETRGQCPECGKVFENTQCKRSRGGCGQMSRHDDWYTVAEPVSWRAEKFKWFWQRTYEPPIFEADRVGLEENLLQLAEMFTPEVFRSMETITPDQGYFKYEFSGKESDAVFVMEEVARIMNIKPWEIQLMFFSTLPTRFSEGVTATPSQRLDGGWSQKASKLVDKGFGYKEIWIDEALLDSPADLIAAMSIELAKYKLMNEYGVEDGVKLLADLTSIVFGFGIFRANVYFKFKQWQGHSHHGWSMRKRAGLPEPVIAYIMAWLAWYRKENTSWKRYLNPTPKKYFEKSFRYIRKNAANMKWTLD